MSKAGSVDCLSIAGEQTRTQSVEVYGGEMFGDNLTNAPVSGRTPRLNDNAVVGARYNYNFTDMRANRLSHHAYFDARSLMDGDGVAVAARY